MRPIKLCRYVNQFLFPSLGIESKISESTAVCWLKKLGFKLQKVSKGIYVDGHEHEDVIQACHDFIEYMYTEVFPQATSKLSKIHINLCSHRYSHTYDGNDMDIVTLPQLKPGKKIHYCIFHDETCMHANDQCSCVWQHEGEQPLHDKSHS